MQPPIALRITPMEMRPRIHQFFDRFWVARLNGARPRRHAVSIQIVDVRAAHQPAAHVQPAIGESQRPVQRGR